MPYKNRAKQMEYMRNYLKPYMRDYRKRKKTIDARMLEELRKKYPDAYEMLLKPETKDEEQEDPSKQKKG